MAKVTGPLMSIDASGAFADTMVYAKWKGINYSRRKRLSIFHECGHAVLPWHEGLDYLCSEKDVDPIVRSRIEREAFGCGSEFLMPREMFVEDALSLETSVSAIERLRSRYVASMEATAIRYAYTHPGLCGVVMIEPLENQRAKVVV